MENEVYMLYPSVLPSTVLPYLPPLEGGVGDK